ncbi:MAG: hypothetical protein MZV49_02205 [Rhodopseudomonas palustris]|nr:hypothetical protein [Rhodopseudomonas palustris]
MSHRGDEDVVTDRDIGLMRTVLDAARVAKIFESLQLNDASDVNGGLPVTE